jgi:hypothetical protein
MSESKPKSPGNYYIDKEKFYNALLERRQLVKAAQAAGYTKHDPEWPKVSNYIGQCFIDIATHMSYVHTFIGYPFRDEMILMAIENCLRYVDSFDPEWKRPEDWKNKGPVKVKLSEEAKKKPPSAFTYFSQTCYYAFIRKIKDEKKELRGKYAYINQLDLSDLIVQQQDEGDHTNTFIQYLKEELDKAGEYAPPPKVVKKTRKKKIKEEAPALDDLA